MKETMVKGTKCRKNDKRRIFFKKKICLAIHFIDFQQTDRPTDCYYYCHGETMLSHVHNRAYYLLVRTQAKK